MHVHRGSGGILSNGERTLAESEFLLFDTQLAIAGSEYHVMFPHNARETGIWK